MCLSTTKRFTTECISCKIGSKFFKQIYPDRTFQNGKSHDNKSPYKQRGLHDKYRSYRCISNPTNASRLAKIPSLFMARSVLPVCNHAVWSKCGTKSVHKINETRNSLAKRPGCSNDFFLDDILVLAPTIETINQNARMTISLLESLGFLINYKKSALVPTQKFLFLGMLIDSTTMEFVLPTEKSENIQRERRNLLKTQQPSIRQTSRVLGLLEFTRPAIRSAPLRYRHIQLLQIASTSNVRF